MQNMVYVWCISDWSSDVCFSDLKVVWRPGDDAVALLRQQAWRLARPAAFDARGFDIGYRLALDMQPGCLGRRGHRQADIEQVHQHLQHGSADAVGAA